MPVRTVTGSLVDLNADPVAGVRLSFKRSGVVAQDGDVVLPDPVETTTASGGTFSIDLLPGNYSAFARTSRGPLRFTFSLASTGSTDLAELLDEAPIVATPDAVTQARAARDDAIAAVAAVPLTRDAYSTVAALLADTILTNSNTVLGQIIWAGGFRYERAASSATDHHVTTAGGVKLYVLPGADGCYNLLAFGTPTDGTSDCTSFFIKAAGSGGRKIKVPAGTYLCEGDANAGVATANTFNIPSNTTIEGVPGATIIRPFDKTARGAFSLEGGTVSSGPDDDLIENVTLRGLTFLGWVETDGHFEQAHLINISGVRNLLVEECEISGARGDGLLVSSGNSAASGDARNNYNITVRKCVFDGKVNGADGGRNAISVINADGVLIEDCEFKGWSRTDMPGSVCFEPNNTSEIIKNVTIRNNKFSDCSGNRGHIALSVDNTTNDKFNNIMIYGNKFSGNTAVRIYTDETAASFPASRHEIRIFSNVAEDVDFFVYKTDGHIHGLYIEDNHVRYISSGDNRIVIGDGNTDWDARDIRIARNVIEGNTAVTVAITDNTQDVVIDGNTISGATQACVRIGTNDDGGATSTRISITRNLWLGTPTRAVQHDGSTLTPNFNTYRGNINPNGLTHNFRAYNSDFLGQIEDIGSEAVAPSAWPFGESLAYITARAVVSGSDTGLLRTFRLTGQSEAATHQVFIPNYDATYLDDIYFRKAIDGTTWAAWFRVTGV